MAEISILLPSLRPQAVVRVVRELSLTNPAMDYEIIIVSPFEIGGEKVVHVLETERRGVMHAINEAYKVASGEYIVVWSDDASPEDDCLIRILDFVKAHAAPFVATFRRRDPQGKEAEQWSVYGKLYAGWLCASKRTLQLAGGLFDSGFKNYWADPDLSLRVWSTGGEVAVCPTAWIKVVQIDDKVKVNNLNSSFDTDTQVFFDRWHAKFGNNAKRVWTDINVPIPHSIGGKIRAVLRKVPYLKSIKHSMLKLVGK